MADPRLIELIRPHLEKARQAGYDAGYAEASRRLLEVVPTMVQPISKSFRIKRYTPVKPITKAKKPVEPGSDDPHGILLAAMLQHAAECAETGDDPGEMLDWLADLAHDPERMADVLSGAGKAAVKCIGLLILKGKWDEDKHPRGKNGRFLSKDRIQAAASDPKVKAELEKEVRPEDAGKLKAAIEDQGGTIGRTKRGEAKYQAGQRRAARKLALGEARKIADKIAGGEGTVEDVDTLASHLKAGLTRDHIRLLQSYVGGGGRRKADMVTTLLDAARDAVTAKQEPEADQVEEPTPETPEPVAAEVQTPDADTGGEAPATTPEQNREVDPSHEESAKETWQMSKDELIKKYESDPEFAAKFDRFGFGHPAVMGSYELFIQRAAEAGKNIPRKVAVEAGIASPWQQTLDEYSKGSGRFSGQHAGGRYSTGSRVKTTSQIESDHRSVVEYALDTGKPVPSEVLADYPDLAAKYGKTPETPSASADASEMPKGSEEPAATPEAPAAATKPEAAPAPVANAEPATSEAAKVPAAAKPKAKPAPKRKPVAPAPAPVAEDDDAPIQLGAPEPTPTPAAQPTPAAPTAPQSTPRSGRDPVSNARTTLAKPIGTVAPERVSEVANTIAEKLKTHPGMSGKAGENTFHNLSDLRKAMPELTDDEFREAMKKAQENGVIKLHYDNVLDRLPEDQHGFTPSLYRQATKDVSVAESFTVMPRKTDQEASASKPQSASKGVTPQVDAAVAKWSDSSKPISERLDGLMRVDTNVLDAVSRGGYLGKDGMPGHNEVFRTLNNAHEDYKGSVADGSPDPERLEERFDSITQRLPGYVNGLRALADKGVSVRDYVGNTIGPDQLRAAADLYEKHVPEAMSAIRKEYGLPDGKATKPAAAAAGSPQPAPSGKLPRLPKINRFNVTDELGRKPSPEIQGKIDKIIGGLSPEHIAALANAPDGADVKITYQPWSNSLHVGMSHGSGDKKMSAERYLKRGRDGKLHLDNYQIFINDGHPQKGQGFKSFMGQIEAAKAAGVDRITTVGQGSPKDPAGGSDSLNGYYTWPRLGYDGEVPKRYLGKLPDGLKKQMGSRTNIASLMETPEGRKWWKENGGELKLSFDLSDGSPHMKRLAEYAASRNSTPAAGGSPQPAPSGNPQNPPPGVDNPTAGVDNTPVASQSAGSNQGGQTMNATDGPENYRLTYFDADAFDKKIADSKVAQAARAAELERSAPERAAKEAKFNDIARKFPRTLSTANSEINRQLANVEYFPTDHPELSIGTLPDGTQVMRWSGQDYTTYHTGPDSKFGKSEAESAAEDAEQKRVAELDGRKAAQSWLETASTSPATKKHIGKRMSAWEYNNNVAYTASELASLPDSLRKFIKRHAKIRDGNSKNYFFVVDKRDVESALKGGAQ